MRLVNEWSSWSTIMRRLLETQVVEELDIPE